MKNTFHTAVDSVTGQDRSGATLTEVLMAILIMGIGMIGVISLFPAAVLRSVQAHALTTSANLRFNAETALALYPQILANPERNISGVRYHQQPDPAFMVDPLGLLTHGIADGTQLGGGGTLRRFSAGFSSLSSAEEIFSSADKWTVRYEGFPTTGSVDTSDNPQTLTFSDLNKQQIYVGPGIAPTRVVIFNKTGDRCQVRDVDSTLSVNTSPLGNNVGWSTVLPGAFSAASFTNADIGQVRIEQRELTFTWLLTAKRQLSSGGVTRYSGYLAMFHKRGYPPTDLDVYANAGSLVFSRGSNTARITIPPGATPFLKRGSYVLDASSTGGAWYRIQDYIEGGGVATITLDSPAIENSRAAVFMKGIVAVFRINDSNVDDRPVGYDEL